MNPLLHFLKYNNAFTIALGILFLATGSAFAASPTMQDAALGALVQKQETVTSIDNTYLLNLDISKFTPTAQVTKITEDDESYFVTYNLGTIDLVNYAWKEVLKEKDLKVSKRALDGNDLGLYVAKELGEVMAREQGYIAHVQELEKSKGPQQKTVATSYSGLIGKFLSPSEEVFPGYEPVVQPPVAPAPEPQSAAVIESLVSPEPEPQPAPTPEQPTPLVEPLVTQTPEPQTDATSTPLVSPPDTDTGGSTSESTSTPTELPPAEVGTTTTEGGE
jgi:hypothetical protein